MKLQAMMQGLRMYYLQKEHSKEEGKVMQLYPAIDIKNGQCVRLKQGMFHDVEVYSNMPARVAAMWEQQGASFIHLVDLDGALVGHSVNEEVIKSIVSSVHVPTQLGGGIRTMKDIETILGYGVTRVILGTKAVQDPIFVKEAVENFGADKIVVGVDARNGMVAIEKAAPAPCPAATAYDLRPDFPSLPPSDNIPQNRLRIGKQPVPGHHGAG